MQFAYSRDLELDDEYSYYSDNAKIPCFHVVDDVMRQGLCEVCRIQKATQHIKFTMYGNVYRMPVGGKTYNKATLTVSLCDNCAKKGDEREKVRSNVCGSVFLGVSVLTAILTCSFHGSIWAGVTAGVLFGGIAAGVVNSVMADGRSKESICELVPRIKALLDAGWHFGDRPGKG